MYAGTYRLDMAGAIVFGDEHHLEIHVGYLWWSKEWLAMPHGRCRVENRRLASAEEDVMRTLRTLLSVLTSDVERQGWSLSCNDTDDVGASAGGAGQSTSRANHLESLSLETNFTNGRPTHSDTGSFCRIQGVQYKQCTYTESN